MYPPALVARLCLALLCLSPLNLAHAAPTPGETDLIRERQDRLLEEQRRRLEELGITRQGSQACSTDGAR